MQTREESYIIIIILKEINYQSYRFLHLSQTEAKSSTVYRSNSKFRISLRILIVSSTLLMISSVKGLLDIFLSSIQSVKPWITKSSALEFGRFGALASTRK